MTAFTWGSQSFPLHFTCGPDAPATVACSQHPASAAPRDPDDSARLSLVEVLVLGEGRAMTSVRTDRTAVSDRLRWTGHDVGRLGDRDVLEVHQLDETTGLEVTTRFERFDDVHAYRVTSTVRNGGVRPVTLQGVSTVSLSGLTGFLGPSERTSVWTARNEWCAENRWSSCELMGVQGLPDMNPLVHHQAGRGMHARTATSTWSSGEHVPTAALTNEQTGRAMVWEVESSGPWRWEINSQYDASDWITLVLMGPDDLHHSWMTELAPGEEFTTVPASFALSDGSLAGAVGELTRHRRLSRLPSTADAGRPLLFNDYMNALMGDPTTEKLLPLIDAAAAAGAQYFCIDAGWYDDGGNWWPSVGAWEPSTRRFGELGLTGVLQHIRDAGMQPGLWVEPEVVGVRSPKAAELPEECFMHRAGVRIVEHDRYFLDLRSRAARDYLDGVFDRLIGEYGARYFKLDYNVTPGTGPDDDASSPGEGLLDHVRAHLEWFDALRRRHPGVIVEACSSGAQRMDQGILRRFDLQSTSDQQDYRLYPTIAAAAPMAMAPEQAGNWAYPQSEMDDEQIAFNLVTGLSGRLYLAGNLDQLDDHQLSIVREATALYPDVIAHHARALPQWPLGLPAWTDPVVALGSAAEEETLLFVWNRDPLSEGADLRLEQFLGDVVHVETLFPTARPEWATTWDPQASSLHLNLAGHGESARVLRVRRA